MSYQDEQEEDNFFSNQNDQLLEAYLEGQESQEQRSEGNGGGFQLPENIKRLAQQVGGRESDSSKSDWSEDEKIRGLRQSQKGTRMPPVTVSMKIPIASVTSLGKNRGRPKKQQVTQVQEQNKQQQQQPQEAKRRGRKPKVPISIPLNPQVSSQIKQIQQVPMRPARSVNKPQTPQTQNQQLNSLQNFHNPQSKPIMQRESEDHLDNEELLNTSSQEDLNSPYSINNSNLKRSFTDISKSNHNNSDYLMEPPIKRSNFDHTQNITLHRVASGKPSITNNPFQSQKPSQSLIQTTENQQRQKILVELAQKAVEEVDVIEKIINTQFKDMILQRFKKAVKCIIAGVATALEKDESGQEAVEASTQALQFIKMEISKVNRQVQELVEYKIPPINNFQPMITLGYNILGIRDEVNLPIEDFVGQVLISQTDSLVILNRDIYECSIDESFKKYNLNQIFSLKSVPKFFESHQGNLFFDTSIFVKRQQSDYEREYFSTDKYEKQMDFNNVQSAVSFNEDCVILSHYSMSRNYLSVCQWFQTKNKYETVCHLNFEGESIFHLRCVKYQDQFFVIGTRGKQIVSFEIQGDPCTFQDHEIQIKTFYTIETAARILDLQLFSTDFLAILTQSQEVLVLKNPFQSLEITQKHQLPLDSSRENLLFVRDQSLPNPTLIIQESNLQNNNNPNEGFVSITRLLDLVTGTSTIVKCLDEQAKDEQKASLRVLQALPSLHKSVLNQSLSGYLLATQQKSSIYKETQLVALSYRKL